MEGQAAVVKWLLLALVACSSPPKRPDPPPPPDAAVVIPRDSTTTELRVKKRFRLEVFDIDPVRHNDAGERASAEMLTVELRDIAREYAGITLGSSRRSLMDLSAMVGCTGQAPACLSAIARSVNADRIIYGTVDGSTATLHLFVVATDVTVDWSTDKLPNDQPRLAAVAHDAIESLLSRAP